MEKNRFSIIIVTYNAGNTIKNAIQSVLSQDYLNFELIIKDAISNDDTEDIVKSFNDERIRFISNKDKDIYDAMNQALKYSEGDFVLFLGADDRLFDSNVLKNVNNKIHDPNNVYYGNVIFESQNKLYDGRFNAIKLVTKNICHQAIFYPKNVYKEYEYPLKYKLKADHFLNLFLWNKIKFKYIDEVVSIYNDNGASALNRDELFENDLVGIVKDNFNILIYLYRSIRTFIKNNV
jgi:glycosyltransferase involved in cell wall biosynthesis